MTEEIEDLLEEEVTGESSEDIEGTEQSLDDLLDGVADEVVGEDPGETKAVEKPEKAEKKKAEPQRLARGRMPKPLVWVIRFKEDGTDSEIARRFHTTSGKISDIRTNAGFKYITDETKFSQEDIDSARDTIKHNFTEGKGRGGKVSDTTIEDATYALESLDKVEVSDTSTVADQMASTRKPRGAPKKKEAPAADESEKEVQTEGEVKEEVAMSDDELEGLLED